MGQGRLQQGRAPTTGFLGRSLRSQLLCWGYMAREGGSGATGRRGSRSLSAPTAHPEAGPRRRLPEPPPGFAPLAPSESLPVPGDSPRSGQPEVRSLLRRWQKLPCGSHGPGLRPSSGPDLT